MSDDGAAEISEVPDDELPDLEDMWGPSIPENPAFIGGVFLSNLGPDGDDEILSQLITPESVDAFGDFSVARTMVAAEKDTGIGSLANRPEGASDVAYMKLILNMHDQLLPGTESLIVSGAETLARAFIASLVWRPERGMWLVHSFGDYARPEEMPRTSPGEAPTIDPLAIHHELDNFG